MYKIRETQGWCYCCCSTTYSVMPFFGPKLLLVKLISKCWFCTIIELFYYIFCLFIGYVSFILPLILGIINNISLMLDSVVFIWPNSSRIFLCHDSFLWEMQAVVATGNALSHKTDGASGNHTAHSQK